MVSVLMGVHKIDRYSFPAIDSILNQKNVDFELIIVANGDECESIQESIKNKYKNNNKVKVLSTPIGQLAHALNIALSNSKYDYIARMDSDDIAHPERLSKQLSYLKEYELDLIGSNINLIDEDGEYLGVREYPKKDKIKSSMLLKCPFSHPSVLCKKNIIIKARGYNSGFNSEDYDLWLRLRRKGISWDNMDESLLDYRVHSASSQGNLLGYAEVSGYMIREFVLSKNPIWLFSFFIAFFKSLFRGRRK